MGRGRVTIRRAVGDGDPNTPPNIDAVTIVPDTRGHRTRSAARLDVSLAELHALESKPNHPAAQCADRRRRPGRIVRRGGFPEHVSGVHFRWRQQQPNHSLVPSTVADQLLAAQRKCRQLAMDADLLRRVMLRPNWLDHPNFSGSNPLLSLDPADAAAYPSIASPGNPATPADLLQRTIDGVYLHPNPCPVSRRASIAGTSTTTSDGVPDSVWVDLGFPPQQTPDGRLYKPLFAILCVDLDSRINRECARFPGTFGRLLPPAVLRCFHCRGCAGHGESQGLDREPGFRPGRCELGRGADRSDLGEFCDQQSLRRYPADRSGAWQVLRQRRLDHGSDGA